MSMSHSDPAPRALRLELLLDAGLTLPDAGAIGVFHPRAGESLTPLPRDRVQVITPHAPDHAAFQAQGFSCTVAPQGRFSAAIVCLPRSRAEGRDLIAMAARLTDGPVIIDGQKTDGADATLRELKSRVRLSATLAKGHGKAAWFPAGEAAGAKFEDWRVSPAQIIDDRGHAFQTLPGVFSSDGIDQASALLARALPAGLKGVGADLGAGWGYLSWHMLKRAAGVSTLHLIDSDSRALDSARVNVTDPRARFHWADATTPLPRLALDFVIMNPPFHQGRDARPQLGTAFIRAAAAMLRPSGQLWMVANRHLPYEPTLAACFRSHVELPGLPGFKLFHAEGPLRTHTAARTAPTHPAKRTRRRA